MLNNKDIDNKYNEFNEYYENELFELNEGCWILNKTGHSSGYQITSKLNNIVLPEKISKKFYEVPINNNNIEEIIFIINNHKVDKFSKKVLIDRNKIPKEYSILLKFNKEKFYVCYNYNFSKLKYLRNNDKELNNIIKRKMDIEYKLYVLKNLKLAKL